MKSEKWEILDCGLRDFVFVGKVVLYSLIVIQFFSFFPSHIHISYFIFHSCLEPLPSLPSSLSNSSFLAPFLRHPITLTNILPLPLLPFITQHQFSSHHSIIPPSLLRQRPKIQHQPIALPPLHLLLLLLHLPTRRGTKGSTISYDRASSKNRRFS